MTELIEIRVECYSGYKADEYPIFYYRDAKRFEIREIIDRGHQGDRNSE
jgi:hypothetical protein